MRVEGLLWNKTLRRRYNTFVPDRHSFLLAFLMQKRKKLPEATSQNKEMKKIAGMKLKTNYAEDILFQSSENGSSISVGKPLGSWVPFVEDAQHSRVVTRYIFYNGSHIFTQNFDP